MFPARRLTVASIAPVVDGRRRPAPQPLGTWMSRWATALYLDPQAPAVPAPVDAAIVVRPAA